jgi:hypothetical protein
LTLLHANVYGSFKGNVAWDWDWLKVMLLDWTVIEEEPLVVFKTFKCSFAFLKMLTEMRSFRKKAGNCHVSADSRWEMLLKVVGQRLGNAQRV